MAAGVDIIKAGLAVKFMRTYKQQYERNTAANLAAAVANELFSDPPSTDEAAEFLTENRQWIEQEIQALATEAEICEDLTQAVRVKAMVAFAQPKGDKAHVLAALERLKEFGVLVPGEEQPSWERFSAIVRRYQGDVVSAATER